MNSRLPSLSPDARPCVREAVAKPQAAAFRFCVGGRSVVHLFRTLIELKKKADRHGTAVTKRKAVRPIYGTVSSQ